MDRFLLDWARHSATGLNQLVDRLILESTADKRRPSPSTITE